MGKRKVYRKKPFESNGTSSDTSANIYHSMLISSAWKALSNPQRALYILMKDQYYFQKKHPYDDPEMFCFNRALYQNIYGAYQNRTQFVKDRDALIEKGFIEVVADGTNTRTKTIYRYCDKWQRYGSTDFSLDYSDMSVSLVKKRRKKE